MRFPCLIIMRITKRFDTLLERLRTLSQCHPLSAMFSTFS